jgi:outer membrane protein assembly factor BamB
MAGKFSIWTLIGLMTLATVLAISAAGTSGAAGAAGAAGNWFQWRGPNRDGVSTETDFLTTWPAEGPKILWKAAIGNGFSAVSVADGRAYTMGAVSGQDTIWCFDAESGKEIWKSPVGRADGEPCATPAISDGKVYGLTRSGTLVCVSAADGKPVWSKSAPKDFKSPKPGWAFCCSPLVLGKAVIYDIGGDGNSTVALDKATGEILWKSGNGTASYGSPVPFQSGGRTLLALFKANGLVVIDAAAGAPVASFDWRTQHDVNAATPIVSGDKIFISSGYGHGCALVKLEGGKLSKVYENKEMMNQYTSCVLRDGYLYGISDGGNLRCLEMETGKVKWSQGGMGAGAVMLAGDKLIVMADGGTLAIVEAKPDGFKQLATAKVLSDQCWTMPVLAGGRIYCRNTPGTLVCVDVRGK